MTGSQKEGQLRTGARREAGVGFAKILGIAIGKELQSEVEHGAGNHLIE